MLPEVEMHPEDTFAWASHLEEMAFVPVRSDRDIFRLAAGGTDEGGGIILSDKDSDGFHMYPGITCYPYK